MSTRLRLVNLAGIESEMPEELAFGVQDADIAVRHQEYNPFSVVPAADADPIERAPVAQGDLAVVHLVLTDAAVRGHHQGRRRRSCFLAGGKGVGRGAALEGPMGTHGV